MKYLACILILGVSAASFANSTEADIARIIDEGKNRNKAYNHLLHLTRNIGARLTGSPQCQKAAEWAASQFKKWGCENVHLEQWGEMAVGSYRGSRQVAKMTAPYERDMVFTTPAWWPGTDGRKQGPVVIEPASMDEFNANKDKYKGSWILMRGRAGMRGVTTGDDAQKLQDALAGASILGRVWGTNDERVHTSGRFAGLEWEKRPTDVRVFIRKSDYDIANAYTRIGQRVEFTFDIENKWVKGPVPLYNVVADIKGTERPDEMVIVCGHLDSWNGPGSQGANDNGTGTTVAMEAARILCATGVKPKRTIRFILWTGEEQGLLGSRAYVEKHKDDMKKISAVLNDDGGTNYQGGYNCLENMKSMLDEAIAPVKAAFADLPMENTVVARFQAGGSSDHAPFAWQGVPAFFTRELGKADYGYVWHTQNDRPENSMPYYMAQSSTNHAAVAYYLANHQSMLPHFTPPERGQGGLAQAVGNARVYQPGFDMDDHDHSDPNHNHDDDWYWYVINVMKTAASKVHRL